MFIVIIKRILNILINSNSNSFSLSFKMSIREQSDLYRKVIALRAYNTN